jgi:hypothetical protein
LGGIDVVDGWTTHHEGTVGGRPVEVQSHSEGGYRVRTDQGADHDGSVITNEAGTAIMPPTSKGRPIEIEGETVDEIRVQLSHEGFDERQIEKIVGHFPPT